MAAMTERREALVAGLVDADTFFERAARGDRDPPQTAAVPKGGVGAAALPRASQPPTERPAPHPRRSSTRRPTVALPRPSARAVACGGLGLAFLATTAALVHGFSHGRAAPADRPVAGRPATNARPPVTRPLDVLGPRSVRLDVRGVRVQGVIDDPGSGVSRAALNIDGRPVDAVRFACRPICPPAARFSLQPASTPPTQPQALAVVARDAAGNRTLIAQRIVMLGVSRAGAITARLEDADRQIAAGSAYAIVGRLVDRAGAPIPHARVELTSVAATATAKPTRAAAVATDDNGHWRAAGLEARDGSRLYVAHHRSADGTAAVSPVVRAIVPIALAARGRRLRSGRRAVVGRIAARAHVGSARLLLATRHHGGWRTERVLRAPASGHFEVPVPARARGRVAVFAAPSPDSPYAPAGRVVDLARP